MTHHRLDAIDAARGGAVAAMVGYHGCWDLWFFGLIQADLLTSPLWLAARTAILGAFLGLSGLVYVLATADGVRWRAFLRRLAVLAGAAAAVSAASFALFPESPIFFGVLHLLAVASVAGLGLRRLPGWLLLAAGIAVFAADEYLAFPLFDQPALRWIGLMTYSPASNDYVPVFPWSGLFLAGMAAGRWWRRDSVLARWRSGNRPLRALTWLGRHSLAIYLLHQPLLYGGVWAGLTVHDALFPPTIAEFAESCRIGCEAQAAGEAFCRRVCACTAEALSVQGLLTEAARQRLSAGQAAQVQAIIDACR